MNPTETSALGNIEDHLGFWLRSLSNAVSHSFKTKLEGHDVAVAEWLVLRTLYDKSELSVNDVAAAIGMHQGPISRVVDKLVQKEFVTRSTSLKDRRAVELTLTPDGRSLVPLLVREAELNEEEFFSSLSDAERKDLEALVKKAMKARGLNAVAYN